MRKSLFALAFALAALEFPAAADAPKWIVDFDHASGSTDFHAIGHPSALKINGHGSCPKGALRWEEGKVQGDLSLPLDSLDTGIQMRTSHMKEKYLEVRKYSQARLSLTAFDLPDRGGDFSAENLPFRGKLLLHGIEKPVNGVAKVERKGAAVSMEARFGVKISDYGIAIPSFAGITVADEVTLLVRAKAALLPAGAHP